ncbi:MAG TPA: cbb3-type cytochrome c oxidase subunit 3 [Burkholderiales bacterium]|nr:cbb3-type cytochrome c oxidase subunit 3 [Burkholderiales bacterium]
MDYEIARSVSTVVMFVVFVGIALWAYSARQRTRFDEAAQLPLEDELGLRSNAKEQER